jgi:hypothetical protein
MTAGTAEEQIERQETPLPLVLYTAQLHYGSRYPSVS